MRGGVRKGHICPMLHLRGASKGGGRVLKRREKKQGRKKREAKGFSRREYV